MQKGTEAILLSVVVCTYNRSALLANALQSLVDQTLDKSEYEVIVVDNNSTDSTWQVATEYAHKQPNFRAVLEMRQGLSHARNRGWQEARGEYVAYIDDDCTAPEHWLTRAKEIIAQTTPGVFGGPFYACYSTPKPGWFKDTYASGDLGSVARPLADAEYLSGCCIFFRRDLLAPLGGFDPELGMAGDTVAYGEETALQKLIRDACPEQLRYYDPELYVYHVVRPDKMTLRWNALASFASGRDAYRALRGAGYPPHRPWQLLTLATLRLLALGAEAAYATLFRDRRQYPFIQNYLLERAFRHLQALGALYEQRRLAARRPRSSEE